MPKTVALMDRLFDLVKEANPDVGLKYNKFYVGLIKDGRAYNYAQFRPQKNSVVVELRLPRTDETDAMLEEAGIETLEYSTRWARHRIRVTDKDVKTHTDLFKQLIGEARERREGVAVHRPTWKTGRTAQTFAGAAPERVVWSVKKLGTRRFLGAPQIVSIARTGSARRAGVVQGPGWTWKGQRRTWTWTVR